MVCDSFWKVEIVSSSTFSENLTFGQIAESKIVKWITRKDVDVLPVYDIKAVGLKGPRLLTKAGGVVIPDLLAIAPDKSFSWIETKHKTCFSWHRISESWVTGIDFHHYREYQRIRDRTGVPVYLLFLHPTSQPSESDLRHGCPIACPTGLFSGEIDTLKTTFNHVSANHGRHGMIYWSHDNLDLVATIEEVESA